MSMLNFAFEGDFPSRIKMMALAISSKFWLSQN